MKQSEFNEPIDIWFDKWLPGFDWIHIIIYKFQTAKEEQRDKTTYWIFEGKINSEDNPFKINPNIVCRFWFSKILFKREIQKHLSLHTLDWDKPFDILLDIKRPSKFCLSMQNVKHKLSNTMEG